MSDLGPVDPGHAADAAWLRRWRLRQVGDPHTTASSTLIAVVTDDGAPAMLKIARTEEEARGADLLAALDGHGAARMLRRDGEASLIERATGPANLVDLVRSGRDDEATHILCAAAAGFHAASAHVLDGDDPPLLIELRTWYRHLFAHADELTPLHRRGAEFAAVLLDDARDEVVLHGDLHHGNVLDFGDRGWLAIDPKGLLGERAFDYCNLLCNPSHERALAPGRLEHQLGIVVAEAGLERGRLARWLVSWCALSSTWFALDDDPAHAESAAAIGELALGLVE
ncbi:aminoglycoside phosphotransferase family protein [Agromyces sp. H66]|uniref:aminoglycoside phosphotransferase family protein n=1 Tax=Agromyces sp. H66 TaxID=2529859 RepID=UPI0010A9E1D4|nr:aminoglycoside phosphotransferase family protein [Agromyces sp. H66]